MTELTQIKKWVDDFYGEERCFINTRRETLPKYDKFGYYVRDENGDKVYEERDIPSVVIYYPEIKVQSSSYKDVCHTVVDCWLKFEDFNTNVNFTRTTLTSAEYQSNYFHSHASTNRLGNWSTICTGGSDSPFAQAFTGFCENAKLGELSEELMWYYLTAFEEGFRTESTNTTPHIKISSIGNKSGKYYWSDVDTLYNITHKYIFAILDPKYNITTDEFYYEKDDVTEILHEIYNGKFRKNSRNISASTNFYLLSTVDGIYYNRTGSSNESTSVKMKILEDMVIDCKILNHNPIVYVESPQPEYVMGTLQKLNKQINDWYKQYKQSNPQQLES